MTQQRVAGFRGIVAWRSEPDSLWYVHVGRPEQNITTAHARGGYVDERDVRARRIDTAFKIKALVYAACDSSPIPMCRTDN